ncbi:MAG TPA: histidinol-phosphatase HisJ family protein [Aggregatilinea sp.]|uniref:histidinol-phosphatase HisJ family protein n=1 Tax=Aggregatilinea sp. TaxID=2806333 RepID=UPI002CC2CE0A|nr:histidinol-phosphatase HisJ family protein [Aggregatilinea sp.]HML24039.1 histidinol-phosphatase HisJ family protein [Aggregatilinea sp.]
MDYKTLSNGHFPMDYHMHTHHSCDARDSMTTMAQAALAQGIHEIAFTEHFDPKPEDICAGSYDPAPYFAELEEVRQQFAPQGLTIRAGLEVGEYHLYADTIQPVVDAWPYDYVLGSLHWVGDNSVFDADYFSAHTPADTASAYFTELAQLARHGGFDVLSHADVIKRTSFRVYGRFDIADWEDVVRPVWQACIDNGIGIEINTSGLRLEVGQTQPSLPALKWYHDMGGDLLTLGSDSHRPEHVGFGLAAAMDLAREAGFTRLCTYERRQVAQWIAL